MRVSHGGSVWRHLVHCTSSGLAVSLQNLLLAVVFVLHLHRHITIIMVSTLVSGVVCDALALTLFNEDFAQHEHRRASLSQQDICFITPSSRLFRRSLMMSSHSSSLSPPVSAVRGHTTTRANS